MVTTVTSSTLTDRELQVLKLIAEGQTGKQIGNSLKISAKTAESHRNNIKKKLHIDTIAGLVRYAVKLGLVTA